MTLIDAHLPVYQFRELHQLLINAAPDDLLDAVNTPGLLLERNLARDAPFTWAVILGLMKSNSIVAITTDDIPLVRHVIAEHAQRPFAGARLPTDGGVADVLRPLVEVD